MSKAFEKVRGAVDLLAYRRALATIDTSGPYDSLDATSRLAHQLIPTLGRPHLNLVIPNVAPSFRFAGVKTALQIAGDLSTRSGLPLRVVTLDFVPERELRPYAEQIAHIAGVGRVEVASLVTAPITFTPDDAWVATYWTTAHVLEIAAATGTLDPTRVIYLVQDYEPSFSPWSTAAALTRSTYHAGFSLIVNSKSLRDYLARQEEIFVADEYTFAPALENDALAEVARRRSAGTPHELQLFFYARPSKPRNLYPIGAAAIRLFADQWARTERGRKRPLTVVSAGEAAPAIGLRSPHREVLAGQTTYASYYEILGRSAISLSLMMSPHPSHPPLEAAVSGAISVTNSFDHYRDGLHPRLLLAKLDPTSLSERLLEAAELALGGGGAPFVPIEQERLGLDLSTVVANAAKLIN